MNKLISTFAFIAVSMGMMNAQNFKTEGSLYITPGVLTSSKSAVITVYDSDNETAEIYDANFNLIKNFKIKDHGLVSKSYAEIATVKPTEAKVTDYRIYDNEILNNNGEKIQASSMGEMIQKLKEEWWEREYTGFIDHKGNISCYTADNGFYYPEYLGSTYPDEYYSIIDGYVTKIRCDYELVIDAESADWQVFEDVSIFPLSRCEYYDFYDYDTNNTTDKSFMFSQTLFNDDNKWEYIVPLYGSAIKTAGDYWQYGSNDKGLVFKRNARETYSLKGYAIYNEDGNMVAQIDTRIEGEEGTIDYICIIGGNIYFKGYVNSYDILYKYDRSTTSIQEVARVATPFATLNGKNIDVNVENSDADAKAVLVGMNGVTVASSAAGSGANTVTLNVGNVPSGIYNVALIKNGKSVRSQKILVK